MPAKNIKVRVDHLEVEQKEHREMLARHQLHIDKLETNVNEIRVKLAHMATKDDVQKVGADTQTAINGILRDALNTAPEYAVVAMTETQARSAAAMARSNWIMAGGALVSAVVAFGGLGLALWPRLLHIF